jgi:hypothetical protein
VGLTIWTVVVAVDRDRDGGSGGRDGGRDGGNGDDENDKTMETAEMAREVVDNGNGR